MAYSKVCPECGKKSYSASKYGSWICPYCGCDIKEVENEKERKGNFKTAK